MGMDNHKSPEPAPKDGLPKENPLTKEQADTVKATKKVPEKELSEGDKITIKEWVDEKSRSKIVEAAAEFRGAPKGSDGRITYEVIKDKLKTLLNVDIDAHIDEYLALKRAEGTIDKVVNPEAEGPAGTLDGVSQDELFNPEAPTEETFR